MVSLWHIPREEHRPDGPVAFLVTLHRGHNFHQGFMKKQIWEANFLQGQGPWLPGAPVDGPTTMHIWGSVGYLEKKKGKT